MQTQWRDIIIYMHGGGIRHISDQNASYDPLHFVLLFPRGDPGWEPDIPHVDPTWRPRLPGHASKQDHVTVRDMVDDEATEGGNEPASTNTKKRQQVRDARFMHAEHMRASCVLYADFSHQKE